MEFFSTQIFCNKYVTFMIRKNILNGEVDLSSLIYTNENVTTVYNRVVVVRIN